MPSIPENSRFCSNIGHFVMFRIKILSFFIRKRFSSWNAHFFKSVSLNLCPWLTWHSFRTWRPWHPWHEPLQNYRSVQNFESKLNLKLLSVSNLSCIFFVMYLRYMYLYQKNRNCVIISWLLLQITQKPNPFFCTSDLWTVVRTNFSVYWRGHKKSDEKSDDTKGETN